MQEEIGDTSQERTTGVVEGLLARSYYEMAIGQDDRSAGYKLKARLVYDHYQKQMGIGQPRAAPPPLDVLDRTVLNDLLDTQNPVLPYAARAVIRSQLGLRSGNQCAAPDDFDQRGCDGGFTRADQCARDQFRHEMIWRGECPRKPFPKIASRQNLVNLPSP